MKARLTDEVQVVDIAVFAELAVWEPRPELQLLCRATRDHGGLDEALIDQVLPGLSDRGRRNLTRHLAYIRLMNRDGELTGLGRRCADSGEAPAWEQGAYHLLVAIHPLFGCHVLDYMRTNNDPLDRDFDLRPLPPWLTVPRTKVFASSLDHGKRFSIASFPAAKGQDPMCRGWEKDPARVKWEIDLLTGVNQWVIEGDVGSSDDPRSFRSIPEAIEPTELAGLFASWEPRWNQTAGRLLMAYDGRVNVDGRESFERNSRYKSVEAGQRGAWSDVEVQGIPVGPKTAADAREWATAILVGRTEAGGAFMTPSKLRSEWEEATEGTPLEGRAGKAPDPTQIVTVKSKAVAERTRWLLSATADIGLEA